MDISLYLGLVLGLLVSVQLAVATLGMFRRQWREEILFRLKRDKLAIELTPRNRESLPSVTSATGAVIAANASRPPCAAWEGWRTFRVAKLVRETAETTSVYFAPEDGRALPRFLPGQYVTLALRMKGELKPVIRCYSLSHAPGEDYYRCTVKEVPPPADRPELPFGKASRHINRRLEEGEFVDLKAPHGNFTLDLNRKTPVVLMGAGIGVTPLFSMLQAVVIGGSKCPVFGFLQFRSGEHHPLKGELTALVKQHPSIRIVTSYSAPNSNDALGRDYDLRGRLSLEVIQKSLGGNDHDFYICGPNPFMESMVAGLESAGVAAERIHFEAFGPASVKRCPLAPRAEDRGELAATSSARGASGPHEIRFDLSGITTPWTPQVASLLDLAESHQIPVESGCRAGNCGTCLVPIKSGKVVYSTPPGSPPPSGTCLPCICVPDGPLVLQA